MAAPPVGQLPGLGVVVGPGGALEVGGAPMPMPAPVGAAAPMGAPSMPAPIMGGGFSAGAPPVRPDPFGLIALGARNVAGMTPELSPQRVAQPVADEIPPMLRRPEVAPAPQPRPAVGGGMAGGGLRQPSSLDFVAEQLRQQGAQVGAEGQYQLAVTGIEAQQQAQIAEAEAQAQRQREQALQEFQARQAQYEADQAKRQREVEELSADVAATKIDPANYFSQQPAWAKVLSLLSVAVGGFAQGYTRGQLRNTALDMMNDAIARDIDAQKANLASKRASVAEKQSLYAQARQKFGDDQSAYLFADARMSEAAANAARRFAAEARGAEQKERATMIAQTFEAKAKESDAKVGELFARQREAAAAAAARAAAGPTLAQKEQLARTEKLLAETEAIRAKTGAPPEGMQVVSYEGKDYLVPKEAAKEIQEQAASAMSTKGLVKDMVSLGGASGFYGPGSTKYEDFLPKKGALAASWAKTLSGGFNPSAVMEERAQQDITLPPRTDIFGAQKQWKTRLESIPEEAHRLVLARLEAVGAMPVTTRRTGAARREYEPAAEVPKREIQTYTSKK